MIIKMMNQLKYLELLGFQWIIYVVGGKKKDFSIRLRFSWDLTPVEGEIPINSAKGYDYTGVIKIYININLNIGHN